LSHILVRSIEKEKKGKPEIPSFLIRDVIDGEPFYYKVYREVLNKTKTFEEIIGCSTLQALIVHFIQKTLWKNLNEDAFHVFSNEAGLQFSKKVRYGLDLAVFDIATLPFENIDEHYANVPPVLIVEVDMKVDTKHLSEEEFVRLKTNSLLDHGAGKVIWITSKNQKVLVAGKDQNWIEQSLYEEFELMNGIKANVGDYLRKKGVPAAQF